MNSKPPGWGSDELSSFIDATWNNAYATFVQKPSAYSALSRIDGAFHAFLEGLTDPSDESAILFAYRSHAAFLASCTLAMTGQVSECYMVLRGAIENGLYSNHINTHPELYDVWRNRGADEDSRRACRREFATTRVFDSLRRRNAELASMVGQLYERTIDYGAHPNEAAVFSLISLEETDEAIHVVNHYVAPDDPPRDLALRSCAQAGLLVLDVLASVFPERADEVGLNQLTAALKPEF